MKALPLSTLATFCSGTLHQGDGSRLVTSITTDSRSIQHGQVFFALVGDRFDAHDFLTQVASAGAAAVVISKRPPGWESLPCAVIEVQDTLAALQSAAHHYRLWHKPLVIGITGSNGKTSTKDLTRALFSQAHQVCATVGNLNNHIGCPLSILQLKPEDTCGIFEMGMNHPGEIAPLAAIAEPDIAIITNIGMAHIENMGTQDAIALEKGSLAEAVHEGGYIILNANDPYSPSIAQRCRARVITAGIDAGDIRATGLSPAATGTHFQLHFPDGTAVSCHLPIPGTHMVGNAALAAAAAWNSGISPKAISAALSQVALTHGRLETKHWNQVTILDDSYNANPDSVIAGLRTLAGLSCTGRRIAVLGRMGELGTESKRGHTSVGQFATEQGIDALFTVGDQDDSLLISQAAQCPTQQHFTTHTDCAVHLKKWLQPGDLILLKGSRSARMETVLTHLFSL
jgi:UDP-N-acetylmuramoyl-tripeptide--D-alanyl-D-alanine ligase